MPGGVDAGPAPRRRGQRFFVPVVPLVRAPDGLRVPAGVDLAPVDLPAVVPPAFVDELPLAVDEPPGFAALPEPVVVLFVAGFDLPSRSFLAPTTAAAAAAAAPTAAATLFAVVPGADFFLPAVFAAVDLVAVDLPVVDFTAVDFPAAVDFAAPLLPPVFALPLFAPPLPRDVVPIAPVFFVSAIALPSESRFARRRAEVPILPPRFRRPRF